MLSFEIERARPVPYAATPLIALELRVTAEESVQALLLRCQVRIDAPARAHSGEERERLRDLFGEPERPVRGLLWQTVTLCAPPLERSALLEIELPVSYDLALATTKYFDALDAAGTVPLLVLFSGSIFHGAEAMRVMPVPWSKEARFALPVRVWRDALARHYPGGAPPSLRADVLAKLNRYREAHGHATWDAAVEALLSEAGRR